MRTVVLVLVVWHLCSLLLAGSIFGDVNTRLIGLQAYYLLHLLSHVSIIAVAFCLAEMRRKIIERKYLFGSVVMYGSLVVVSTAYQAVPVASIRLVESLLVPATILSLAVCLPRILRPAEYRVLFGILTVVLATLSIVSLSLVMTGSSHFLGRELMHWGDYRGGSLASSGLYGNPNTLGAYLAFFPAIIVFLMYTGKRYLLLYVVAFTLVAGNLTLTFSRSSLGVAFVSLLPLVWVLARRRMRVAGALAGVLALVLVVGSATAEFRNYVARGLTLGERGVIWQALLPRVAERPALGFGLLNVSYTGETPHNVYLAQLLYYGCAGFLAFMTMFAAFGRRVYSSLVELQGRPEAWVLTALLVGAAGQGMVEYIITYPLFFSNSLFWLILGAVANRDL